MLVKYLFPSCGWFVTDWIKKDIQQAQQADPSLQLGYEAVRKFRHRPTHTSGTNLHLFNIASSDLNCCYVTATVHPLTLW